MTKIYRAEGKNAAGHEQKIWVVDDGVGPFQVHDQTGITKHNPVARSRSVRKSIEGFVGKRGRVVLSKFKPGEYYPRIWRGFYGPKTLEHFEAEWLSAVNAGDNLFVGMREVFRTVEPTKKNMAAFGHEIRHLILLACNEVEAQAKAVLRANGYTRSGSNWNMRDDYFKLARPMRLADWTVRLARYPGAGMFRPFAAWSRRSYKPLSWYAAHNAVKHDREVEFHQATVRHLIEAMSAVFIMTLAQFGQFGRNLGFLATEPTDFTPRAFEYKAEELFVPPFVMPGAKWHAVHYAF